MSAVLEPALSEALRDSEDPDAYWAAVDEVRTRDPAALFEALSPLASSGDPLLRSLVPDVLRRVPPLLEQTVGLLRQMLASEADVAVLDAIAGAFIDLKHPAAAELVLPLTRHELPELRLTAMQGLFQAVEQTMDRFIELTSDADPEVRNWAFFSLSTLLELRPQHAGALGEVFARGLNDPHAEAKAEAALGLARCLDRRAIEAVSIGLRSKEPLQPYIEAAEFLILKRIGADVLRRALSKL